MDNINLMINSMLEYIEILISIALSKNLSNYVERLDKLKEDISNIKSLEEVEKNKNVIKEIDTALSKEERQLTSREQALVERGYSKEDVERLTSFTNEDIEEKKNIIIDRITKDCKRTTNPICIYLGGQPGCGKSTTSRKLRSQETKNGLVDVSLDNYRSYHPHYLEIEDCINEHWEGRTETPNDTKGNDIADFTHNFAGVMSDKILDELSTKKDGKAYNIVLEWGMRTPEEPLLRMEDLKNKGYTNVVDFILLHKEVSKEACKIRADIMNSFDHIIRRVPDYFHDLCVETLPDSAQKIYEVGYEEKNIIDQFMLSTRNNKIVWDQTDAKIKKPKDVYRDYLDNISLSNSFPNNYEYAVNSYKVEEQGFNEINNMLNITEEKEHQDKFTFH